MGDAERNMVALGFNNAASKSASVRRMDRLEDVEGRGGALSEGFGEGVRGMGIDNLPRICPIIFDLFPLSLLASIDVTQRALPVARECDVQRRAGQRRKC